MEVWNRENYTLPCPATLTLRVMKAPYCVLQLQHFRRTLVLIRSAVSCRTSRECWGGCLQQRSTDDFSSITQTLASMRRRLSKLYGMDLHSRKLAIQLSVSYTH